MIADLPLVCFVIINLTRLTAGVCMKVRFKSKVTRGFSFSPLRDSCSPLRGSLIGKKKKKNLWDQGNIPEAIYTSPSWPLLIPCQETQMAAVQIPFVKKLQTTLQETYYTNLKYKNGVIFVPSFVFIGLFLRPRCFRKEA